MSVVHSAYRKDTTGNEYCVHCGVYKSGGGGHTTKCVVLKAKKILNEAWSPTVSIT